MFQRRISAMVKAAVLMANFWLGLVSIAFGTYMIQRIGKGKKLLSCYFGNIPQGADPEEALRRGRPRECNFKDFNRLRYDGRTCVYSKCVDFCYKIYVEGLKN